MAQTGYTPIQLYYSSTTTNVPLAANLAYGELAINITDGKLFYKDNANAIQVIGWKVVPATAGGTGQTSYAVGDLIYANTTTTLAKLADVATGNALISGGVNTAPSWGKIGLTTHVSGTLPTANGGTNLTSFTANGIVYASSTSALATNSALTWSGTVLTATGGGGAKAKLQDNTVLLLNSGAIASGYVSFQRSDGTQKAAIGSYYNVADEGNLEFIGPTGSTNARLSSAGDFSVTSGNVVIGTSGKGIDFSATPGTGTSELFADYEEGTFTPLLKFGAGNTGLTATATGLYTKIGRQLSFVIFISLSAKGSSTGGATIFGLPYTATSAAPTAIVCDMASVTYTGSYLMAYIPSSAVTIDLYQVSTASTTQLNDTNFANNSVVRIAGMYFV